MRANLKPLSYKEPEDDLSTVIMYSILSMLLSLMSCCRIGGLPPVL